jgi:hypothetical protein
MKLRLLGDEDLLDEVGVAQQDRGEAGQAQPDHVTERGGAAPEVVGREAEVQQIADGGPSAQLGDRCGRWHDGAHDSSCAQRPS